VTCNSQAIEYHAAHPELEVFFESMEDFTDAVCLAIADVMTANQLGDREQ